MKAKRYFIIAIGAIYALCMAQASFAATYVFGEDALDMDLTTYETVWTSSNTYIIAGDCYVEDNDVLLISDGVTVQFDYDYDGDYGSPQFPTITVRGTIICEGTEGSEVTFTNLAGTTSGEFEGLLLDGSGDYEGNLQANKTTFEYGGLTTALIQLGESSVLDLDSCIVSDSFTSGIATVDTSSYINLFTCTIESNGSRGLYAPDEVDSIQTEGNRFTNNGHNGMELLDFDRVGNWSINDYADGNARNGLVIGVQDPLNEWYVRNGQFYDNGVDSVEGQGNGILIEVGGENFKCTIRNCASASNVENGIRINDYDAGNMTDSIRILNCVLWDNGESGLEFNALDAFDLLEPYLVIQNNIIGENSEYGIVGLPGGFDFELPYNINAFKDNGDDAGDYISVSIEFFPDSTQIRDYNNAPDEFELADETYNVVLNPPYNFHIRWHGPGRAEKTLINSGDSDENCGIDDDGSPTDLGIYGGTYGGSHADHDFLSGGLDGDMIENYITVGVVATDYHDPDEDITIWKGTYRAFNDWYTGNDLGNWANEIIEPETIIEFEYSDFFKIDGELVAIGTSDDHIIFRGVNGSEWNGISTYLTRATDDSKLHFVDIEDAGHSNYSALKLTNVEEGVEDQGPMQVFDCTITGSHGNGIDIINSAVIVKRCTSTGNSYAGIKVTLTGLHDVQILGCTLSGNRDGIECSGSFSYPGIGAIREDLGLLTAFDLTTVYNNTRYGLYLKSSADPVLASQWVDFDPEHDLGVFRWNTIANNGDDQIWVQAGCVPLLENGHNDIYSDGFAELAIDNDGAGLDAENNYWGTDDPATDAASLFTGVVDYTPWDNNRNSWEDIDSNDEFWTAMNAYLSNDPEIITRSIGLMQDAAENENLGSKRHNLLHYLRDACKASDGDFMSLRRFYLNYAADVDDPALSRLATRLAIWCISDEGNYEAAITAFRNQRLNALSRVDSIWAALDEASVMYISGEIDDMGDEAIGIYDYLDQKIESVENMLQEEHERLANQQSIPLVPDAFNLYQPYPNPFNGQVRLAFDLTKTSNINLNVFDVNGRLVQQLLDGPVIAGHNSVVWNASGQASGIYFFQLKVGEKVQLRKAALLR